MTDTLSPFEGREVSATTLILTKTGDGLSQAMKVAPIVLHHRQEVDLVIRARVRSIRLDAGKDDDDDTVTRVQILDAFAVTVVDDDTVRKLLNEHITAVARAKELAGQQALEVNGDGDDPGDD